MIVCKSPFSTSNSLRFPSESSPIIFLGLLEELWKMTELEQLLLLAPLMCLALEYLEEDP
ncbi:hypothetical protein Hanom_Chr16g01462791 [Helianthus anomalus]